VSKAFCSSAAPEQGLQLFHLCLKNGIGDISRADEERVMVKEMAIINVITPQRQVWSPQMLLKYGSLETHNSSVCKKDAVRAVAVGHCHVIVLFPTSNIVAFFEQHEAKYE
jgi:hypothetical protein